MVSANIVVFCIISLHLWKGHCSPLPWQIDGVGPDVHDYVNYDDLSFSKESGVFEPVTDVPAAEEDPIHVHALIKRSDVLGPRLQSVTLLAGEDDMEVAETHLFRPVFRYKSQYTERRRVRTLPAQSGTVIVQQ